MTENAKNAIKAAKNRNSWGRFAARRFCEKRGVSARLYRIACQCEVMQNTKMEGI